MEILFFYDYYHQKNPPNSTKTAKKIKISHFLAKIFVRIKKKQ